jgi:hypothetical protein
MAATGCTESDDQPAATSTHALAPPATESSVGTVPADIKTAFSSGGTFSDPDVGEALTSFPLLRVDPTRFPLTSQLGLTETFPEIGLPRARQVLVVPGHEANMHWTQEPVTYRINNNPSATTVTLASFQGELSVYPEDICFTFLTGAMINETPIRGVICAFGEDYTVADIERFVQSLSFRTMNGGEN